MKIVNPLRRHLSASRSIGRCSGCQTLLWDGMVVDAEGGVSCLACSILRSLGFDGLRPVAPLSNRTFSLPQRSHRVPELAG